MLSSISLQSNEISLFGYYTVPIQRRIAQGQHSSPSEARRSAIDRHEVIGLILE